MTTPMPPLLLISDRRTARRPLADVASAAFEAGCRWIMVREKDLGADALSDLAAEIVKVGRRFSATVTVNGDAAAAMNAGARGVHLPRDHPVAETRSMIGDAMMMGVSAHSEEEAAAAARAGADYVTLSPVFKTASKPGYGPPLGLDEVRRIAITVPLPVIALGGITEANAWPCLAAGAAGVAVMGAVMCSRDPGSVVGGLVRRLEGSRATHERRARFGPAAIS